MPPRESRETSTVQKFNTSPSEREKNVQRIMNLVEADSAAHSDAARKRAMYHDVQAVKQDCKNKGQKLDFKTVAKGMEHAAHHAKEETQFADLLIESAAETALRGQVVEAMENLSNDGNLLKSLNELSQSMTIALDRYHDADQSSLHTLAETLRDRTTKLQQLRMDIMVKGKLVKEILAKKTPRARQMLRKDPDIAKTLGEQGLANLDTMCQEYNGIRASLHMKPVEEIDPYQFLDADTYTTMLTATGLHIDYANRVYNPFHGRAAERGDVEQFKERVDDWERKQAPKARESQRTSRETQRTSRESQRTSQYGSNAPRAWQNTTRTTWKRISERCFRPFGSDLGIDFGWDIQGSNSAPMSRKSEPAPAGQQFSRWEKIAQKVQANQVITKAFPFLKCKKVRNSTGVRTSGNVRVSSYDSPPERPSQHTSYNGNLNVGNDDRCSTVMSVDTSISYASQDQADAYLTSALPNLPEDWSPDELIPRVASTQNNHTLSLSDCRGKIVLTRGSFRETFEEPYSKSLFSSRLEDQGGSRISSPTKQKENVHAANRLFFWAPHSKAKPRIMNVRVCTKKAEAFQDVLNVGGQSSSPWCSGTSPLRMLRENPSQPISTSSSPSRLTGKAKAVAKAPAKERNKDTGSEPMEDDTVCITDDVLASGSADDVEEGSAQPGGLAFQALKAKTKDLAQVVSADASEGSAQPGGLAFQALKAKTKDLGLVVSADASTDAAPVNKDSAQVVSADASVDEENAAQVNKDSAQLVSGDASDDDDDDDEDSDNN